MMPYRDCLSSDPDFQLIHRIGLTGILRGVGQTVGWSNECYFYPDEKLKWSDLYLSDYYGIEYNPSSNTLSESEFLSLLESILGVGIEGAGGVDGDGGASGEAWNGSVKTACGAGSAGTGENAGVGTYRKAATGSGTGPISRREAARLLDQYLDPFSKEIDWSGHLQ